MEIAGASDPTTLSYWFNWRVLLCAIWVLTPMVLGLLIIWKYECLDHLKSDSDEPDQDAISTYVCKDDAWKPCIKEIHPIWLLAFRVVAFCLLLGINIAAVENHGVHLFYYYTQWTFTLVTIYFGYGSTLSIYGIFQYKQMRRDSNSHPAGIDTEYGSYVPPSYGDITTTPGPRKNLCDQEKYGSYVPSSYGDTATIPRTRKNLYAREESHFHENTSIGTFIFQVMFQMSAGAVMLTDSVYWFIIFPFLTLEDYKLNFITVVMHSVNALFLLGDTTLNNLWFPWFRISYFVLWTGIFVIFQWIIHACIIMRWPYPFMDLSLLSAPIWYLLVGLIHIPCYGFFALIVRLKHKLYSKYFPLSYQCSR